MRCSDCVCCEVCKYFNDFEGIPLYEEEAFDCCNFKPQSRFVELPCEVGQTVWIIDEVEDDPYGEPYPLAVKVEQILIQKDRIALDLNLPLGMRLYTWAVVGKNVFLSSEEAENSLKERENK